MKTESDRDLPVVCSEITVLFTDVCCQYLLSSCSLLWSIMKSPLFEYICIYYLFITRPEGAASVFALLITCVSVLLICCNSQRHLVVCQNHVHECLLVGFAKASIAIMVRDLNKPLILIIAI